MTWKRRIRGMLLRWGGVVVSLYLGYGALLYAMQDRLIFPGAYMTGFTDQHLSFAAKRSGAREIRLTTPDGIELYGWHRPAQGKRAVLYFPGNGEPIHARIDLHNQLVAWGWDVVVFAYRGYPGSGGHPLERDLAADAKLMWNWTTSELDIAPKNIVLHGSSLGGGVAGNLMIEVEPAGLLMETTFLSAERLARRRAPIYPLSLLMRSRFRTEDRAPKVQYPVLIVHGDQDTLIPVSHARGLAKLFPNADYIEIAGRGHNEDLVVLHPEARQAYQSFLEQFIKE